MQDIWAIVRALEPLVAAHHSQGDELRRLPDPIAEAFADGNLHRVLAPRDLGGWEVDPVTFFDLVEEVSSYDGSIGWNFAISAGAVPVLGGLPLPRLRQVLAEPDCGMSITAAPPGRAVAVDGGYRLTGRWQWASGIHHARWVAGLAVIFDGDAMRLDAAGVPKTGLFSLRRDQAEVLDRWHTGGLRGTGSTEWQVTEIFVPAGDVIFEAFSGVSDHPAPVFRLPVTFFGTGTCAVALGIARSAVEGLRQLGAAKQGSPVAGYLCDRASAQYAVAKSDALVESSKSHVRAAIRPLWDHTLAGTPVTLGEKARVRAAYVHAGECAAEAVALCYRAVGGAAIFEAAPFERALRDVNAALCHLTLQHQFMELAGQAAFGLPVAHPLF